ncbi:hypothetical protein ONZ45_g10716 [Pleurotus djamor]|nr:hypothetical protein ONZ45_g10716 [Pleurotus djamor]
MKIWGPNVLTENGAEWRRHRRILAPAFTNKTYSLVCQETCSTYHELCSTEAWNGKTVVEIPSTSPITSKFAMILISRCGFGSPIEWAFDKNTNGEMNFATALATVSGNLLPRFVLPKWLYSLPFRKLREVDTAYKVVETFMQDLIASRRREMQLGLDDDRSDVLSLMLRASVAEGKLGMNDEELMGNTFLLLFAGHETTAQSINAVLGLLALHPDIQQEVYEQIKETIPDNLSPTFEYLQKLSKLEACFIEAARLFPAVLMFSRETAEGAILPIYDANGILSQIAVPAGTEVIVDNIGMLYNPRHFPEPDEFRPSRWYNSHDNEFAMFSVSSRTCIGKRFAITEATTFLTLLLRDWKLEMLLGPGETKEKWRTKNMNARVGMTVACPFVNTLHFNESEFKWLTADNIESITDTYEVETKPWKRRWRCKKCGGGVASENMKLRRWSIWGATLDRDDDGRIIGWAQLKPKAHIFYGTRLLDVEDGLDKWEGYENESRRL